MTNLSFPYQGHVAIICVWFAMICMITGLHMWLSLDNSLGGLTFMGGVPFCGIIMLALSLV